MFPKKQKVASAKADNCSHKFKALCENTNPGTFCNFINITDMKVCTTYNTSKLTQFSVIFKMPILTVRKS